MAKQRTDRDILNDPSLSREQKVSQLTILIRSEGLSTAEATEIAEGLVGFRSFPGLTGETPIGPQAVDRGGSIAPEPDVDRQPPEPPVADVRSFPGITQEIPISPQAGDVGGSATQAGAVLPGPGELGPRQVILWDRAGNAEIVDQEDVINKLGQGFTSVSPREEEARIAAEAAANQAEKEPGVPLTGEELAANEGFQIQGVAPVPTQDEELREAFRGDPKGSFEFFLDQASPRIGGLQRRAALRGLPQFQTANLLETIFRGGSPQATGIPGEELDPGLLRFLQEGPSTDFFDANKPKAQQFRDALIGIQGLEGGPEGIGQQLLRGEFGEEGISRNQQFGLAFSTQGINPQNPFSGAVQRIARSRFNQFLGTPGNDPLNFLNQFIQGGFRF